MRASSDTGIIQHAETNGTFLVVFNSLQKEALEVGLLLWCNFYPMIILAFILGAQLFDVVAWNEARVEHQLAQTGKHAQRIG
jgi:hypothetical protein